MTGRRARPAGSRRERETLVADGGKKPETYAGGAGGIGSGTLLVVVADQLSKNSPIRPYLYWAAPSASVVLTGVWWWIVAKSLGWLRRREADSLKNRLRKTLERGIASTQTSEGHRNQLRAKLEELENLDVEADFARLKAFQKPARARGSS
jgi:hypothetical protein